MGQMSEITTNEQGERCFTFDGKPYKSNPGYICLTCIYPQCKCGSPIWGTLTPVLAKEKPHHKKQFNKSHAMELLNRARLFYLQDVSSEGGTFVSRRVNHHAVEARILMELLGYDGNHIDQIIEGWETDYKAQKKL